MLFGKGEKGKESGEEGGGKAGTAEETSRWAVERAVRESLPGPCWDSQPCQEGSIQVASALQGCGLGTRRWVESHLESSHES